MPLSIWMEHISIHRSNYTKPENHRSQVRSCCSLEPSDRGCSVQTSAKSVKSQLMVTKSSNKRHPGQTCLKDRWKLSSSTFLQCVSMLNSAVCVSKAVLMPSEAFRRPALVIVARWRKLSSVGSCFSPKGWSGGSVSKHINTHKLKYRWK